MQNNIMVNTIYEDDKVAINLDQIMYAEESFNITNNQKATRVRFVGGQYALELDITLEDFLEKVAHAGEKI